MATEIPAIAAAAVLVDEKGTIPKDSTIVKGYDFDGGIDLAAMLKCYKFMGFQAQHLGLAFDQLNQMLDWRLSDEEVKADEEEQYRDPEVRRNIRCKVFFAYTSNLISSGLREMIRYLVQHRMVDVVTTTAGGIEEDLIKCLGNTYSGEFKLKGKLLRKKGLNRIGNLLVPNSNYCKFDDWIMPILDQMLVEQKTKGTVWTPSKMIHRFGKEINDERSVYYWAYKNNIPVYCPAITDGSIGDMLYFHSYKNPGLVVDIVQDIRGMNDQAVHCKKSGIFILGGGLAKHHTCNANLMRNGADFSVYVNTAHDFDGSDAGATPDEAVSWGKIRIDAKPIKVIAEATLVVPLIVASCFAPRVEARKRAIAEAKAKRASTEASPPSTCSAAAGASSAGGWAHLVGQPSSVAVAAIKASDPSLTVVAIPAGALVGQEYDDNRVRVFVDHNGKVVAEPRRE